jgi:hypothetical protein
MKSFHRVTHAVAAAWFAATLGLPMPARAGDWAATALVGETVNANTNPQLESTSAGGNVGSTTNLSIQAIDQLPSMSWSTGVDLGISGYWGPGTLDSFNGVHG